MRQLKAWINTRLYDYHTFRENMYIVFDEKILKLGPMKEFCKDGIDEIIDMENNLVLPGFVAAHTHLYSAFARGMNTEFQPNDFREILEQLWWKLDHFLDKEMIYFSAYSFGLDQIKVGTTTLIDHHASHQVAGSLDQIKKALVDVLGVRAILAFETSDRFDVDLSITENVNFIRNNHSDRCAGLFGMHASFTLSDTTLAKIKTQLQGAGIHIHVAESVMDEEDCKEKYHKSVVERLNDFHLLNEKSILVHCPNVNDLELEIIKQQKSVIAINVTSNMNNAVGLPDIAKIDEMKIPYMIGNDGLISSMPIEYLNAYYSAHLKTDNPIGLSLDSIRKAIIQSYTYAGGILQTKIGRIEPDWNADLISVPYQEFTPLNNENAFGHLFFGLFPNLRPEYVVCAGHTIVSEYKTDTKHEQQLNKAKQVAEKLWQIIEEEGKNLEFKN